MTTRLAPRTHPLGIERKRLNLTRDEAEAYAERAVMALAEVGIKSTTQVRPASDSDRWIPAVALHSRTTEEMRANTRRAWALIGVSRSVESTMACIKHGINHSMRQCLGVYAVDVLKDPYIECGAP